MLLSISQDLVSVYIMDSLQGMTLCHIAGVTESCDCRSTVGVAVGVIGVLVGIVVGVSGLIAAFVIVRKQK